MFSSEDFRVDSVGEFIAFLPIFIFVALVSPFLIGVYQMGFVLEKLGWMD